MANLMDSVNISFVERLLAARRILFGIGDNAACCSFCGRSKLSGETIVAGPGVAICGRCAHLSFNLIALQDDAAAPQSKVLTEVMLLAEPCCLLPSRRKTLEADLSAAAVAVPVTLQGWTYTRRAGGSDYLSVRVAHAGTESSDVVCTRFIAAFQRA